VEHACNNSYLGGRGQRIKVQHWKPALAKLARPISKQTDEKSIIKPPNTARKGGRGSLRKYNREGSRLVQNTLWIILWNYHNETPYTINIYQ
jgi:hypothetical protein